MALFSLVKISSQLTRQYSSCICLSDVYILSGVRTPIGCFQGQFSSLNAVQLATKALTAAVEKACVKKEDIQEVVLGSNFMCGMGLGPAHQVALFSGLSESVISSTINKACSSGMKAIMFGCQLIKSNAQEVVAVGGLESLTHVPYMLRRRHMRLGNICVPDLIYHDGLTDPIELVSVTKYAEEAAKEYKYSRKDQDEFALQSYAKAAAAQEENTFAAETVPVTVTHEKDAEEVICTDEQVKRLDTEKFRKLQPEMGKDGTITSGNSSGLHDGAAILIIASGNYVLKKNLSPLARIVSFADGSLDPKKFILAPSVAIPKALVRANLTQEDINRWEISETFAITAMINTKILNLDPEKVNRNGGSISLGHPFGMTGARIVLHLAHTLNGGEMGCACVSHAGGGASAMVIQKMC